MRIFPVTGLPEIREGDDLAALVIERVTLEDSDVLVVAQKAVSKAEGRVVRLDGIEPSARALEGLTGVIVAVNKRYKAHAGIRLTGV